jgi:hypothetical protein
VGAAETAKLVVTGLVKPWDAIEKIGHVGIDRLGDRVQGEPKERYQRLARQIEEKLAQLPSHEVGAQGRMNAAISVAGTLFAEDGLTIDELIRQRLNRDEAIKEQRRRFDRRPESRDEPEASFCRQHVIPAIFNALFADPASLEEIDLAFKQAVLENLGDIQRLPEESAAALKRLAAQALVRKPHRRFDPNRHAPSALLEAAYAVVPFEGREELLGDAIAWCADERGLGIRLYVGPGGMGKTRFAIELCDQVRTHMPEQGWRSGFLARGFADVPEWLMPNLRDGREPLLVVVDYAETKPGDLIKLLALAHDLPRGRKFRVLLLARSEGDWWSDLPAAKVSDIDRVDDDARAKVRAILPGPAVDKPISLRPLASGAQERRGVFERALAAFQAVSAHRDAPAPMPDLSGDDFRSVLMIHLAALAAVEGRTLANAGELLQATLQRERGAWERALVAPSLNSVSATDVQQTMALITLAGGASNRSSTSDIIARTPRLQGAPRALLQDLGNVLSGLYPNPLRANDQRSRPIEPLRPDLLGEELVDRALSDDPELLEAAFGAGVSGTQIENGLTVLTRLAQRRPAAEQWLEQPLAVDLERLAAPAIQVAIETGHPMGRMLAQALEKQPIGEPSRLEALIPEQTTELLDVGVLVMTQRWDRMQAIPRPWADHIKAEAARIANNLASRLRQAGQRPEALVVAKEAADLYRAVAAKAPDVHQPGLAMALYTLAVHLSEVAQYEKALATAHEAAELYRGLAAKAPDAWRPDLALALNSLANRLSEVGQYQEALAPAQQASDLYRKLAEDPPGTHRPALAGSLMNLAIRFSDVGQHEAALAPAREAVAIRRDFADKSPDAWLPDLALALNTLGNCLSDVGQHDEALKSTKEAADLYRMLAARAPERYLPDLAATLSNLATSLSKVGQHEEALGPAQEAADLSRALAEQAPDAYRPALASVLHNLVAPLSAVGRREAALASAQEAVAIRRELAAKVPDAYRPALAGSLAVLASGLEENDDLEGALESNREAIELYRPYFLAQPQAFVHWMLPMCRQYVARSEALGREPDEALLAAIVEALQGMQEGSFRKE